MGRSSFGLVSIVFLFGACTFDSTGSGGGASLGGDDTGDGTQSTSAVSITAASSASGSASASASGDTTPSTSEAMTDATGDPTSTSGPISESESETQPTSTTPVSASETESESATSQGTSTGDPTTGDPTGPPDDPYPACPNGTEAECPDTHTCVPVYGEGSMIVASWCGEAGCEDDDDCPDGGDATPRCRGPVGDTVCVLDCQAAMNGCPEGMECRNLNVGWRCVWLI